MMKLKIFLSAWIFCVFGSIGAKYRYRNGTDRGISVTLGQTKVSLVAGAQHTSIDFYSRFYVSIGTDKGIFHEKFTLAQEQINYLESHPDADIIIYINEQIERFRNGRLAVKIGSWYDPAEQISDEPKKEAVRTDASGQRYNAADEKKGDAAAGEDRPVEHGVSKPRGNARHDLACLHASLLALEHMKR